MDVQKVAIEAQAELIRGDHYRARDLYKLIGTFLSKKASAEKDPTEFAITFINAGIAFMEAALYVDAFQTFKIIRTDTLDKRWVNIHRHNFRVSSFRTSASWHDRRVKDTEKLLQKGKWRQLLSALSQYPYVMFPSRVAEVRSIACRNLGDHDLANIFDKDRLRLISEGK